MSPATTSAPRPVSIVNTTQPLRHKIRFFDPATPTKRAKPDALSGYEIWVNINSTATPRLAALHRNARSEYRL